MCTDAQSNANQASQSSIMMPFVRKTHLFPTETIFSSLYFPRLYCESEKHYRALHKIHIVCEAELFNVYLAVCFPLLQDILGTIHVQEVLDIICESSFHSKLFSCHIASVMECHEISSRIVCYQYSNM